MDLDLQVAIVILRVVGIPKRDPAESRPTLLLPCVEHAWQRCLFILSAPPHSD